MNTQSVPPAGGLSSPGPAGAQASAPKKGTRPPPSAEETLVLDRIGQNHAEIAARHAENVRLLRANAGLFPSDILTRDERASHSGDFDMRVDRMPMDVLAPMVCRLIPGVDTTPACLTLEEAQIVFAFRYIRHGGYGALHVETSEKKRVKMTTSLHGR